jgi:hypothetical protein
LKPVAYALNSAFVMTNDARIWPTTR